MLKVKPFQLMILAIIALSILFPFLGQSSIEQAGTETRHDNKRPDRIILHLGSELSKEEMPAVGFLHDLHTQAVDGKCTACHIEEKDGGLAFKFKRTGGKASMDFYHAECIACHIEKKASNEKSGPVTEECRSCHTAGKVRESSWQKINFDRSLHFRHESAKVIKGQKISDKDNCSACHHQYNEKTKEIFYVKGEEESCGYCHKSEKQDTTRPIRQAVHDACVKCHQSLESKNIDAGPVTCKGCHDEKEQQKIAIVSNVPRLKRNQPDEVALTAWKADSPVKNTYMKGVAFDHKFHETKARNCKSCHHESLKKCNDCHTPEGGDAKGGFVSLEQAMHNPDDNQSCIGCHREVTQTSDCAGCHFQIPVQKDNPDSCKTCHRLSRAQLTSMDPGQVAKKAVTDLVKDYKAVEEDKIPENVIIEGLANEYMPSRFPHRKVIKAIAKRVEKNQLAKAFHRDQAGMCRGCHHNSPKTLTPPKCASCHSKNGPGSDGRPGLRGAYHGQCITCHQKMDVKTVAATDCAKCHEKKKKEVSMELKNKG